MGVRSTTAKLPNVKKQFGGLAVVAVLATIFTVLPAMNDTAKAADLTVFDPGYIISDELFYDGDAMTVAEIQSFLNSKGTSCNPKYGYPCLKDYRTTTVAKSAIANTNFSGYRCEGYTGGLDQSAAEIIHGVAQSCDISPKALLVILQKERGLVTKSAPTANDYKISMGYGCPDTAPCDSQYFGFFNQVYQAANQFKVYKDRYAKYGIQPGRYNQIRYHPRASCGSSSVYVKNFATAGLYIYTPYQPNARALAAGYGTGDSCSAYGNRNFFHYYNDWFGASTAAVSMVRGWFLTKWLEMGGANGVLGDVVAENYYLKDAWQVQEFENGYLVFDNVGMRGVWMQKDIYKFWAAAGGLDSIYSSPISDSEQSLNGWQQAFPNYTLNWEPDQSVTVSEGIPVVGVFHQNYQALGGSGGVLGTVLKSRVETTGWAHQEFSGGWLVHNSTKRITYLVNRDIGNHYFANQGPLGVMGGPKENAVTNADGSLTQEFEYGTITYSSQSGISVRGGYPIEEKFLQNWLALQNLPGREIGYPKAKKRILGNGWEDQEFEKSRLLYDSNNQVMYTIVPQIAGTYYARGGPLGGLGAPKDNAVGNSKDGYVQEFQNGVISWSPKSGVTVKGGFKLDGVFQANWTALKNRGTDLSYALTAPKNIGSSWISQQFVNGWLLNNSSTKTTYLLRNDIAQGYFDNAGPTGILGAPLDNALQNADTWVQYFQNGKITATADGQIQIVGLNPVTGVFKQNWKALESRGIYNLGYSTDPVIQHSAQWSSQQFENGWLLHDAAGKVTYLIQSAIGQTYFANNGPLGPWGAPKDNAIAVGGSLKQDFQNKTVIWSQATGISELDRVHDIMGIFAINWTSLQTRQDLKLGIATSAQKSLDNGWSMQQFQNGYLLYDGQKRIMYHLYKDIGDKYFAMGGVSGNLGQPKDNAVKNSDGSLNQSFTNGSISSVSGSVSVVGGYEITGLFNSNWNALRQQYNLDLGQAVANAKKVDEVWDGQEFSNGWLLWNSSTKTMFTLNKMIADFYFQSGGPGGVLGGVLENATGSVKNSLEQKFEGGTILWDVNNGAVIK